jgi:hypothetical protein
MFCCIQCFLESNLNRHKVFNSVEERNITKILKIIQEKRQIFYVQRNVKENFNFSVFFNCSYNEHFRELASDGISFIAFIGQEQSMIFLIHL